jgi:para-nitrobenzyl esterase
VQDATHFSTSCSQQLSSSPVGFWTMEYLPPAQLGSGADCLTLNVWTPARSPDARAKHALPVLFFIHGGGFTSGSSSVPIYDGARLVARGIIVVTVNCRVGAPGFLAHPELSPEQQGRLGQLWHRGPNCGIDAKRVFFETGPLVDQLPRTETWPGNDGRRN